MPTTRRRLTSEVWRHGVSILILLVLAWLAPTLLNAWRPIGRYAPVRAAAFVFAGMGACGASYADLTWLAYRGLCGDDLRRALVEARSGTPSLVRRLLLAGPRA